MAQWRDSSGDVVEAGERSDGWRDALAADAAEENGSSGRGFAAARGGGGWRGFSGWWGWGCGCGGVVVSVVSVRSGASVTRSRDFFALSGFLAYGWTIRNEEKRGAVLGCKHRTPDVWEIMCLDSLRHTYKDDIKVITLCYFFSRRTGRISK